MARWSLEVSGGFLRSPRAIQRDACDLWNYQNCFEMHPKADTGKIAKELSPLKIDINKSLKYVENKTIVGSHCEGGQIEICRGALGSVVDVHS